MSLSFGSDASSGLCCSASFCGLKTHNSGALVLVPLTMTIQVALEVVPRVLFPMHLVGQFSLHLGRIQSFVKLQLMRV